MIEEDGRFIGAALNIAARVTARAAAGQILCTEAVVHAAPAAFEVAPDDFAESG